MTENLDDVTDMLVELYDRELDGEPTDLVARDRAVAILRTLHQGDLLDIMVNRFPDTDSIESLAGKLEWFMDSPIWSEGIKPPTPGRRIRQQATQ